MNRHPGPRAQAALVLALVATLGALIGILGDRLLAAQHAPAGIEARPPMARGAAPPSGLWRWEARPAIRYTERLATSLALNVGQRAAIDSIVAAEQDRVRALSLEVEPRFRAIAEETRTSIEAVLTEHQRAQLSTLRMERMERMERMGPRGERGPHRGPPAMMPRR
jgi:hypothetical protein